MEKQGNSRDSLYRRIALRVLPVLFAAYVLNHLDRINLGFAHIQMRQDLGLTDASYAFAAGVFFLGYVVFEVPANAFIQRFGGRRVLALMMVGWGMAASATMFVRTPVDLYFARVALGLFEAGFFPGVVFYLSRWFPPEHRGRVLATFMMATVVGGLISGPLSGWILESFHGVLGYSGWQWMFLLQGLPCLPLAVLVVLFLPEGPDSARWLTAEERQIVRSDLGASRHISWSAALVSCLRDPKVQLLALAGFLVKCGSFAIAFWLPALIHEAGVASLANVGLLTTVPALIVIAAMATLGSSSDRRRERRMHFAISALVGAVALGAMGFAPKTLPNLLVLVSIAALGLASAMPVLWALLTETLEPEHAAVGIALVVSLSNLSGMAGPLILGMAKQEGGLAHGFYALAALVAAGALLVPLLMKASSGRQPSDGHIGR